MIDSLRRGGASVMLVDGGDLAHPDSTRDRRYDRFLLQSLEAMAYDVITLGELDLYRGVQHVESILDSLTVPVACANVRFADSAQPIGERIVRRQLGGTTVGIVGLLGQDFGDGQAMSRFKAAGFVVDDPFETARSLVPEARAQADLVIVLAHLTAAAARGLAREVPGIDVLVLGHFANAAPPVQLGLGTPPPGATVEQAAFVDSLGPIMVSCGERGQHLSQTRISLQRGGDAPEKAPVPGGRGGQVLAYSGEVTGLTLSEFPERRDLAMALQSLHLVLNRDRKRAEMVAEMKMSERRLLAGQDHFLGDLKCARCHFEIYRDWQATSHAKAWETLVERNRDADPECISCHVTGIGLPGGYKGIGAVQDMRDVQCESCHGMGTFHDMSGGADPEAGEATCARCHTTENSPEFDFPSYWSAIEH